MRCECRVGHLFTRFAHFRARVSVGISLWGLNNKRQGSHSGADELTPMEFATWLEMDHNIGKSDW